MRKVFVATESDLSAREEAVAMCLGLLKVAARAASDVRAQYARSDSEPPESLVDLLSMMQRTFPDLRAANEAIAWIGLRCGFGIEERTVSDLEGRA